MNDTQERQRLIDALLSIGATYVSADESELRVTINDVTYRVSCTLSYDDAVIQYDAY